MTGVVFKPILPKPPKVGNIPARFEKLANKIARGIEADLKAPTKKWKHRVTFNREVRLNLPKSIRISVTTQDDIYRYQNNGTKAHWVEANPPNKAMRWKHGGKYAFSKRHKVKGVKAQKWTTKAHKKWQPEIRDLTKQLMKAIAKDLQPK